MDSGDEMVTACCDVVAQSSRSGSPVKGFDKFLFRELEDSCCFDVQLLSLENVNELLLLAERSEKLVLLRCKDLVLLERGVVHGSKLSTRRR